MVVSAPDASRDASTARDHCPGDDAPSSSFIAFPTDVPARADVDDRADAEPDADGVEHLRSSPVSSGIALWGSARARSRDDSEDGERAATARLEKTRRVGRDARE